MRLSFLLSLVFSTACVGASDAQLLYSQAMAQLAQFPDKFQGRPPVYTHENLHRGIKVPQYDVALHEYVSSSLGPAPDSAIDAGKTANTPNMSDTLAMLEQAVDLGSSDAAVALADIYTFGNFSVATNYSRAQALYHKAVESRGNGHAYFMLAHFYQTGMFGELPVDKQRAKVYYEFAARNGDDNALLVLAYQLLNGVDCSANCEIAQFYYSKLARQVIQHIHTENLDVHEDLLSHNIHLADFRGGIYGDKISESDSSVLSDIDNLMQMRGNLKESNLEAPDSKMLDYYFDALQHRHGGYFSPRNASKAFAEVLTCAYIGKAEFEDGRLESPTSIDRQIWKRCQGLLGRMYLNGEGTERDVSRAHFWINSALELRPDKENLLDMALLRRLDPTTHGELSPSCVSYLKDAAKNGSTHGVFLYAQSLIAPQSPFETTYVDSTYDLIRTSAGRGHYQSTFYFADAVESGFSASKGELFSCPEVVSFYKNFVERSESFLLPHLEYAFEELKYGNYKNALLGYSIAAEQGLLNSQLSAAFLLYQKEPLIAWHRKSFDSARVQAALKYLDLASSQGHIDSTILLGDLYESGLSASGLEADHEKALAYYSSAASSASAHACYKLGYMYEHGLGMVNNTPDYYLAKRYYDLSIKYYQDLDVMQLTQETKPNTHALGFALLRLRLKFVFSRSDKRDDSESAGWFGTLKKLAKSEESEEMEEKATNKAQAHAEGAPYEEQEYYQLFDYIVLIFTLAFFLYVGWQNLRGQFRRMGQRQFNADAGHANRANRPRFQVEFFFAI